VPASFVVPCKTERVPPCPNHSLPSDLERGFRGALARAGPAPECLHGANLTSRHRGRRLAAADAASLKPPISRRAQAPHDAVLRGLRIEGANHRVAGCSTVPHETWSR